MTSNVKNKVEEALLINLEQELNKYPFRGVAIGGIIANSLQIELFLGNSDWSGRSRVRDLLGRYNLLYRKNRSPFKNSGQHADYDKSKGQALISFCSARRHIFNIGYPIWKRLNEKDIICLVRDRATLKQFAESDSPNSLFQANLPSVDFKEWKSSFQEVANNFKKAINAFLRKADLPKYVGVRILNRLISQSQVFMAYEAFLTQTKPRFILVEYDRFSWSSPLILAAKAVNIPSFSMMHGAVNNKFGYMPMLANELFCWGERQKKLLNSYLGTNENHQSKIRVSGAPQLSNKLLQDKQTLRNQINVTNGHKVALLATSNVKVDLRYKVVEAFCSAVKQSECIKGVVRLHPSEDLGFYSEYIEANPNVLFDKNDKLDYEESLALADLVCIYNSAYGLDAAMKQLPMVIINVNSESLGQSQDFIDIGKFPVVTSGDELQLEIERLFSDSHYLDNVRGRVKEYAEQYCQYFGQDAAEKTISLINSYLAKS